MLQVIGCITNQHDLRLVVLAAIVYIFSCYTAFSLMTRAHAPEKWSRYTWLAAAAFVTGGGVWATHFIAELAYRPGLPVAYDVGLTLLSVVIAVSVSGLGLALALRPGYAAWGGAIVGAAVVSMHYTGMMALRLPATAHWDAMYVAASIVISVGVGSLALWAAQCRTDLIGHLQATGLLVLAIVGLHFTAMTAVTFTPDPTVIIPQQAIEPQWLAVAIAAIAILIVSLGLIGSVVDRHLVSRSVKEAQKLRQHVIELEATKRDLENTATQLTAALKAAAAASQVKSQFLATMSHELRTPLNAIIGFSDILKKQTFGPVGNERYRAYHADIFNSGTHLLALINDILDVSKLDTGHIELQDEWVDLKEAITHCVHVMGPEAEKGGVRLCVAFDARIVRLRADARRLRQILLNLLSNAVKFTPEGGGVNLSTSLGKDGLRIAIADTGIGMAPHEIEKALALFGQIDSSLARRYEGTGLGLPLSKHLIELHGGTLAVSSTAGSGTVVTLLFPLDRVCADRQVA